MKGLSPPNSLLLVLLLLSPDYGEELPLPSSTNCCTQLYRGQLSKKLLRKVIRVEMQQSNGDCHLQAFVLHLSRRTVCIHSQNRSLARWFEHQGKRFRVKLPV